MEEDIALIKNSLPKIHKIMSIAFTAYWFYLMKFVYLKKYICIIIIWSYELSNGPIYENLETFNSSILRTNCDLSYVPSTDNCYF